jgi:hypothetical protein
MGKYKWVHIFLLRLIYYTSNKREAGGERTEEADVKRRAAETAIDRSSGLSTLK